MNGLCRIYYFKANEKVTDHSGENKVRTLGGNVGWTELNTRDYDVKIKNLCAARNAAGNLSYCVFTSEHLAGRSIDEVIDALIGKQFTPGFYQF